MLNRLMFVYFIQKKGFLAGDERYLANRLTESRTRGMDRYYRKLRTRPCSRSRSTTSPP
jgi:hypothetical protein